MKLTHEQVEAFTHTINKIENMQVRRRHALVWAGAFKEQSEFFNVARFLDFCGVEHDIRQIPTVHAAESAPA